MIVEIDNKVDAVSLIEVDPANLSIEILNFVSGSESCSELKLSFTSKNVPPKNSQKASLITDVSLLR